MSRVADTVTYRKACSCKGVSASSGPHIRVAYATREAMHVEVQNGMACDGCGKPWKVIAAAPSDTGREREHGEA